MKVLTTDDKVLELGVFGSTLGLRIKSITLDCEDVESLSLLKEEAFIDWFYTSVMTRFPPCE